MRYRQILASIVVGLATVSIAEEPRTSIGILTCSSVKSADNAWLTSPTTSSVSTDEQYCTDMHHSAGPAQSAA